MKAHLQVAQPAQPKIPEFALVQDICKYFKNLPSSPKIRSASVRYMLRKKP
jgi:hypothetical protein